MKLNELNYSSIITAKKALKEHYNMPLNLDRMNASETRVMLQKVRKLVAETKQSGNFYRSQNNHSYLKLVFMEQALSQHLSAIPRAIVMLENEEVEKSQVYLAAQAIVDDIQKMIEDVGQMQVKELPALVSSIETDIGVTESETFNEQVMQQLTALSQALSAALPGLKDAVRVLTNPDEAGAFGGDESGEEGMDDMSMGGEEGMDDMSGPTDFPEEEPEEPEAAPVAGVGRSLR